MINLFSSRPFMIPWGDSAIPISCINIIPPDHTTFMVSLMWIYFKETGSYGVIILILGLFGDLQGYSAECISH